MILFAGPKWFKNFLKRHKDVRSRIPSKTRKGQAQVTRHAIMGWLDFLYGDMHNRNLDSLWDARGRIFNADETAFRYETVKFFNVVK
jgi:hypothetical protein